MIMKFWTGKKMKGKREKNKKRVFRRGGKQSGLSKFPPGVSIENNKFGMKY